MKKVLSVVLALVMVLTTMVMLVPTASAVATGTDGGVTTGAGGKIYYEQNFDDPALADLVDKDLAAAIGWTAPGSTNTMLMDGDALRIVAQYTPSGVYPATENKWAGAYETIIVKDEDLVKNAIVLEYTFKYNRREPKAENDLQVTTKDNTQKVVRADGQGAYQFAAFGYSGNERWMGRINLDGNKTNNFKAPIATDTAVSWRGDAYARYNELPVGTTYTNIEYNDAPFGSDVAKVGTWQSSILDREYTVKTVIDPVAKFATTWVDGVLFGTIEMGWVDDLQVAKDNGGVANMVTNTIRYQVKPGMDVTVDDIKISEYVPHLTISEAMINGTKASGTGKYQWVELTNPSDAPVNVYDYALHLYNMPTYGNDTQRKALIGSEKASEFGTNQYYIDAGSTLGYFTPGAKTLDNGEIFDSPAYADGVLQPGESAIVLLPQTAMAGDVSVTDEAFNAYLTGLGMPEGTKTFVCDNKSDYNFTIGCLTGESGTLQVVKATNQASDGSYDPKADCEGQWVGLATAFAESTAFITSKSGSSGTVLYGTAIKYMSDKYIGMNFADNTDRSVELSYSDYMTTGNNVSYGFKKYNTGDARLNQNGESVNATPGYVPTDVARQIDVDYTDINGTASVLQAAHARDLTVALNTTQKKGYTVQVWVDGVCVATPTTNTYELTIPAAEMTNADHHTIEVTSEPDGAIIVGFQQSEVVEGKYSLRVLAGIKNPFAYDTLGFDIVVYLDSMMLDVKEVYGYECQYVYQSVTQTTSEGTETIYAKDLGFDYFFAIHIKNIDGTEYPELSVEATALAGGEASSQGTLSWSPAVVE